MTILRIPYIVPLFLGMTYDARNSAPGVAIFDEVKTPLVTDQDSTQSYYKIVTDKSSIRDALDVSGEVALKIKLGNLDVKGSASYLKNDEDMRDSVLLLFKCKHITNVTGLGDVRPIQDWARKYNKEILGTHYVYEVVYGVEMVAVLKFTANKTSSKEEIHGNITLSMKNSGENITNSLNVDGQLDKVKNDLKDISSMEISYFGTLPLKSIPTTLEGVKDLVTNFRQHVIDAGLSEGLPMEVHLKELSELEGGGRDFAYDIQDPTQREFKAFLDEYLRLTEARDKLFSWSRSLPFDLSDRSSQRIGQIMKELNDDLNDCYKIIAEVDLSADSSVIRRGKENIENKGYRSRVEKLIKDIDDEVAKTAQVSTATYIHWGNNDCPGSEATKIVTGHGVGASTDGVGGMAQYDCMEDARKGNTGNTYELNGDGLPSQINTITYGKFENRESNPFKGGNARSMIYDEYQVPCTKCHQKDASTVSMFSATTKCPGSWELKYTGLLMSAPMVDGHTTEYICIDDTPPRMTKLTNPDVKKSAISLTLVSNGGSLPEKYEDDRTVPCVVCAMKGGRLL